MLMTATEFGKFTEDETEKKGNPGGPKSGANESIAVQ
jgi:hypothetical protein